VLASGRDWEHVAEEEILVGLKRPSQLEAGGVAAGQWRDDAEPIWFA
jgi:hypothetical protein